MRKTLTFLGTGGSVGVPMIGCQCEVCRSIDPFNKRLRPSVLIRMGHRQFLIDAGPDFRAQALKFSITKLDAVLLTHAHHDHTAGLDDLRPLFFQRQAPLPILLSHETAKDICMRYYYLFQEPQGTVPRLVLHYLPDEQGNVVFEGLPVQYVTYTQGGMSVNGFRIGELAYLSDIKYFSPSIFDRLNGVKYLIISALRYTASPLHLSVDEAVDFANELKAELTWLTHISHELEHQKTNSYLPDHINLAYDGLEIEFD